MRKSLSKEHSPNSILNRSQSAMEYLMTYGWAILIIAIVLVALFSLGIFNSSNFAPRAQPGSCEVLRNSAQTSLVGQCNGMLPEYVAIFPNNRSYITTYVPGSTSNITVSFWFYLPPSTNTSAVFPQIFQTQAPSNALVYFALNNKVPTGTTWRVNGACYTDGILLNIGAWNFFVANFSYLSGMGYASVNGKGSSTTASCPGKIGSYGNVILGTYGGSPVISGMKLSNVQIYNTSLSNSSMQALYKEGIGGAPINVNNLVGWWPLNGNANDYSGYGNDGTAANVTYTSAWTSSYSAP